MSATFDKSLERLGCLNSLRIVPDPDSDNSDCTPYFYIEYPKNLVMAISSSSVFQEYLTIPILDKKSEEQQDNHYLKNSRSSNSRNQGN
jgi:hypothetical protein